MDPLTLQGRMAKSFVPVIVAMIITLSLQIVGFVTPGWFVASSHDGQGTSAAGLWFTRVCIDGNCTIVDHSDVKNEFRTIVAVEMSEYQVETSIALGMLVIAIVMYCCLRCGACAGNMKNIVYCTVFCALISGILALVAAGKLGKDVRRFHDTLKLLNRESPVKFPYSLILTGIGGILANLMALLIMVTVKPRKSDSRHPPSYEMPVQPNVVAYSGQTQPGYDSQRQHLATYAVQSSVGHNY